MSPKERKVVIITGAAGGIGSATAARFAAHNFSLVLSDRDKEGLDQLAARLEKENKTGCFIYPGNLEDPDYIKDLAEQAIEFGGRIDVLINNAAWRTVETMRTISFENWEKAIRVNLTAPAFLAKYVVGKMEEKKTRGVIINMSSVMARNAAGYSPAYIAAKGGIESLTYELAALYGPKGIRIVAVSPGNIETRLSNDYTDDKGRNVSNQLQRYVTRKTPLQRAGQPEEIANACYWLSSEEASFITGTSLLVDGGFLHNFNSYDIKRNQFPGEF